MNWKEFKDHIESEGVTDNMEIGRIYLMEHGWSTHPPRVKIIPNDRTCNPEKYKIVIID